MAGCATNYHEASRAVPGNPTLAAAAPVWIFSIDGQRVVRAGIMGDKTFTISPGKHLIELQYSGREYSELEDFYGQRRPVNISRRSRKNLLLPFLAVEQKHYYVHAGLVANFWRPYIDETAPNTFSDLPVR